MRLCDQSLMTLAFLWEKLSQSQFYNDLSRKTVFLRSRLDWSSIIWDLYKGTNLKFYISVAKGLKLKVRKFWGLVLTFVWVTGEKLVEGAFLPPPPPHPILNRVKALWMVKYSSKFVFIDRRIWNSECPGLWCALVF